MTTALADPAPSSVRFNPADPAFIRDPYPTYAMMRRHAPSWQAFGTRILTRYYDVAAALRERSLSVSLIPDTIVRSAARLELEGFDLVERFIRGSIVFTDNPAHVRLRRLVNQAYAPRAIEQLRPLIDGEIAACLQAVLPNDGIDLVSVLARPLPVRVLCRWLSIPSQHEAEIALHVHRIRLLLDPGLMGKRQYLLAAESLAHLTRFFRTRSAEAAASGEGLVAALVHAEADGDRLSDEEVAFACIMSFVAGTETTQCLIANTVLAIASRPEQETLLRCSPSLVPKAVEESIRFHTPLQFTKRVAQSDFDLNGVRIGVGEQILLCLGSANRDERVFAEPDVFDVRRERLPHVGFGYGLHACLGGLLARLQAERALSTLLERYAMWKVDAADVQWQSESLILRGPAYLKCSFSPASSGASGALAESNA